jgi:hypothetical protein
MKRIIKNINQCVFLFHFFTWAACCCGLILPSPAFAEQSVADEIISLNVTEKPLGEVLKQISAAASCRFSVDESWSDYPVTASFENEPLSMGLKRILRNINNAVIYGSDRTIRILFYDNGATSGSSAGNSYTIQPAQEPLQLSQPFSEATAPQPEVALPDESRSAENPEQLPQEASESESETDNTAAESAEATEPETGETVEETADLAEEQKEETPEAQDNQVDETPSAN